MVERLITRLASLLTFVAGIALVLMMVQMVADVILRFFFNRPIEGSLEIVSVYHMVAVVFLPLALVELTHGHISVDVVVQLFPKGVRRAVEVFGYIVCAVFFAVLGYQTLLDALESFRTDEILMSSIYVTIWPAKFLLPIGFGLVLAAVLLHAWKAATDPEFEPVPKDPAAAGEAKK
jgi:TRAP-type C4-dicarboxylate transport system permease small subunit